MVNKGENVGFRHDCQTYYVIVLYQYICENYQGETTEFISEQGGN